MYGHSADPRMLGRVGTPSSIFLSHLHLHRRGVVCERHSQLTTSDEMEEVEGKQHAILNFLTRVINITAVISDVIN